MLLKLNYKDVSTSIPGHQMYVKGKGLEAGNAQIHTCVHLSTVKIHLFLNHVIYKKAKFSRIAPNDYSLPSFSQS